MHEQLAGGMLGFRLGTPTLAVLQEGCLVPIPVLSLLRSALRFAGVLTLAARTTSAVTGRLRRDTRSGASGAIWEEPAGVREYPMCAEGWAMWAPGRWPDLPKATGGTAQLGKPFAGRTS